MRALLYGEDFQLAVLGVDLPVLREGEVLVRVEAAGICGSDVHGVASRSPRRSPPLIMGHEFAGEVIEVAGGVSHSLVGTSVAVNPQVPCRQCVYCRSGRENVCGNRELIGGTRPGGFAEYVTVPARCVHAIGGLDASVAVFAEPLATCVHACALVSVGLAPVAVVIGAGAIGTLAAQMLRLAGVRTIVISDEDEGRRRNAAAVADYVVVPDDLIGAVGELTSGRGVNTAIDAVGVEIARRQSLDVLAVGGVAIWLGMHSHDAAVPAFDVVVKEQRVQGAFAYTDPEFATAVELLVSGAIKPAVSQTSVAIDDGANAFVGLLDGPPPESLKTVIRPTWRSATLVDGSVAQAPVPSGVDAS